MNVQFKIKVKDSYSTWWETYDKDVPDPVKYAKDIIKQWNEYLQPHECERELLDVQVATWKSVL